MKLPECPNVTILISFPPYSSVLEDSIGSRTYIQLKGSFECAGPVVNTINTVKLRLLLYSDWTASVPRGVWHLPKTKPTKNTQMFNKLLNRSVSQTAKHVCSLGYGAKPFHHNYKDLSGRRVNFINFQTMCTFCLRLISDED